MSRNTWRDPSYYIKQILVEESCLELPYTREIIARADLPWSTVPDREPPMLFERPYPDNLTEGKRYLFLSRNRGQFFKPCPATREYRCCDYHVLNTGMNCPIDCVYCILQAYLNNPWLSFYVNVDDLLAEIDHALSSQPAIKFRIGTGEFTDSLAIDRLTGLSRILSSHIASHDNAILELKTKSAAIDNLADIDHKGRTIIAWSLNSPRIMQREELRAATLEERLHAAKQCAEWGYRLAFHFDPIIEHDGWEEGYKSTIDQLYRTVPAESIVWISLGALRYLPKLKEIGNRRFPGTCIYAHEFVDGLDGKARYFRHSRVVLYRTLYERLKHYASDNTCIYFCMESDEVWRDVMGFVPSEKGGVPTMLEQAVWGQKSAS